MPNAQQQVRVALADHLGLVREAVAQALASDPGIELVGTGDDSADGIEVLLAAQPSVLVAALRGAAEEDCEVLRAAIRRAPEVKFLVLSLYEDRQTLARCLQAGVAGFVGKSAGVEALREAIRAVSTGRLRIDLQREDARPPPARDERGPRLSEREREVVRLVALGFTSKEAGTQLGISSATVDTYRVRVSEKLGLRRRADFVRYAMMAGMLDDASE